MTSLTRLTAICVGMLLVAAPAAFACGELSTMTSQCPMAEMGAMRGSTGTSICHTGGQMSEDCCGVESAPEPMRALSHERAKLLTVLEVTGLHVVMPPVRRDVPARSGAVDAFRLHDVGRYTLFSSFLL